MTGLFVVPLGKGGNYSFRSTYLIQPQGHHVVYTGFGAELLDESKGATYHSQGDWETYEIFDVYMESGI